MQKISILFGFLLSFASQVLFSQTGLLFNVAGQGTIAPINFDLCLDGYGPLSCQNFTLNASQLFIKTTRPNHTYPAAGIKINTPGFYPVGCTPIPNGYCIFTVSDTVVTEIDISNFLATLSASVENMLVQAGGTTKIIVITNRGPHTATDVNYSVSPALPSGGTIVPATCGNIPAGGQCRLSVSSGLAMSGPAVLTVKGFETNTVNVNIYILAIGNIWQGGIIYYIDDTTPPTTSITGAVIVDLSSEGTMNWALNFNPIPSARSISDGRSNTTAIVQSQGASGTYPAKICLDYTGGGVDNWYLPAICELAPPATDDAQCPTDIPNSAGVTVFFPNVYWSSTEFDDTNAWEYSFQSTPTSFTLPKNTQINFACVHTFVPLP